MRKKKKVIYRFLKKVFFVLVGLGLVSGSVFFLRSDFLNIKRVDCQFNGNLCQSEIWWDLTSSSVGKNILFFSTKNLTLQIQNKYPNLKSLAISKKFPQELIVKIEKREPKAIVKTSEEFFVVDDQGFVLEKSQKSGLPLILFEKPVSLGINEQFTQSEIIWAVNLVEKMKFYLFTPKETRIISPRNIEVSLDRGLMVIFSSKKSETIQLDSLQFIFSRSKIESKGIKKIDLRFDKPVVIYE